ncbi:unnamed protein product [Rhodiola kirilowii]
MTVDDVPMDDKAKRMRDLLSSFYSPDPANSSSFNKHAATLDAINTPSFDPDQYMNLLVQKSNLEGLLQRHVEMAAEIKNLDTDLQMLVYENYNKFISATDTIKRMKNNIVGMEANMEQLLEKIMSVQSRSDGVNTSLFEKREHIEKLHRTRNLLRKVQFIYDLPTRLGKCIKSGAYADAVRYYTGAMPIFKVYGDSSFQDCKKASEEAVSVIMKNLQEKLFSDTESIQTRAEAVMLLKQLDFPQEVANRKIRAIQIELEDLRVTENTRRYIGVFAEAIDELIPEPTEPFIDDDHDILMTQRSEDGTQNADGSDSRQTMPPEIKRFYEVYIRASSKERPYTIREVKASHIGQLVRISGIVTRCSDVKPLMQVAVYTCEECGFEIYQEVTARVFMPLYECPTSRCKTNNTKGNLILQLRASKFVKFQEAKIQELAEHVPKGHIPRSMTIHFRGELTRKAAPGDVIELSGIFLPIPYTGFRAMRAGLVADTYLEAMSVTHFKKKYEEYELQGDEEEQIARLAEDGDIYNKLSRSLAPEIYGHEDVKKALLLLLVGAPHRKLKDGMMIRGDLHICLMGDPGVAKSQLLKHIVNVAPRGVYTTGKGSSGVGLTAAVQRDPVTNEMVLEGGALVLADMGICAIDEFDKMEDSDRTAIHEVMEQQTVSIAKAGITTSLNARTAVLAAANPAWGRYDMRRTPAENINLPPALLSRFDLLWLILDRADMDSDLELARHVLYVHQNRESPALGFTPLEPSILRAYISTARKLSPTVPRELEEYIASAYSGIRQEEAKSNAPHTYTTVRTLLSILRISAALARLRFAETVAQSDVDEALRLMQMSKFSLYSDDRQKSGLDAISDIYSVLRDEAARSNKMDVSYAHALNWISRKGYSEAQLKECLEEYAALNVWQIHPNTFDIRFIDA